MADVDPWIDQAFLEDRFTARAVRGASTDDGGTSPNETRIANACLEGTKLAYAILHKSLSHAEIMNLAADEGVMGAAGDIAMSILVRRKPEWNADGEGPYRNLRKNAEADLKLIAEAERKPAAQAAPNPVTQGHVRPAEPDFQFAPTPCKPKRGGY